MAVSIRLKRIGRKKRPVYRIVAAHKEDKRSGKAIELIGKYDPNQNPSNIDIDKEKYDKWIKMGAKPTEAVVKLLE